MPQVAVSLGETHAQGNLRSPFQASPDALIHFVCAGESLCKKHFFTAMEAMAQANNTNLFKRHLLSAHIPVFKSLKEASYALEGQERRLRSGLGVKPLVDIVVRAVLDSSLSSGSRQP